MLCLPRQIGIRKLSATMLYNLIFMIKYFYHWLLLLTLLTVLSCNHNDINKNVSPSETIQKIDSIKFFQYYSNLKELKLPLTLKCGLASDVSYNYAPFNNYFERNFDAPLYVAGKIYKDNNFISLLYGIVGDDLYPVLFNYNNDGTKLDSLDLSGNCDGDEDFLSSTTVTFNQDYSILKIDSVTRYSLNYFSQLKASADTTEIVSYKYRILKTGYFSLEDSVKKEIINAK